MATTQNTYTGDGSTTDYTLTFPYLAVADVRVSLDDIGTTAFTLTNATTLRFTTAPGNGVAIRIYRVTDDANNKIVFSSGSTIKAGDLNDAVNRNLYIAQETTNNLSDVTAGNVSDGSLTTAKLADSAVTTAKIASSAVTTAKVADNAVATAKIADGAVTTAKIASDAVDDTKLSNSGVTSGFYAGANLVVNEQGRITSAGAGLVAGMIMMFQGATAPSGWAFCDGQNGTPDLRDRFIVGSGSTYSLNTTGGSADATLVSHSHTTNSTIEEGSTNTKTLTGSFKNENHSGGVGNYATGIFNVTNYSNSHNEDSSQGTGGPIVNIDVTHRHTTDSQGSAATNANLPPYYALAFIIKL